MNQFYQLERTAKQIPETKLDLHNGQQFSKPNYRIWFLLTAFYIATIAILTFFKSWRIISLKKKGNS